MNSNPFNDLLNAGEQEMSAIGAIAKSWSAQPGQVGEGVGNALTGGALDDWQRIKQNLGALAVGIGLFLLGTLMIAFSAFEDIANTAEKALGIASDPVGGLVGKGKPLLKKALTDLIP